MSPVSVLLALLALPEASASDKPQILTVVVTDAVGAPIPTAWVRIPETEGRRDVDPETGRWEASMLYTYDGRPYVFLRGMVVDMTISAPGYVPRKLLYEVRPRRNVIEISLEPMPMQQVVEETDGEELLIDWFSR